MVIDDGDGDGDDADDLFSYFWREGNRHQGGRCLNDIYFVSVMNEWIDWGSEMTRVPH